jgi:hypothetical protein
LATSASAPTDSTAPINALVMRTCDAVAALPRIIAVDLDHRAQVQGGTVGVPSSFSMRAALSSK